jgi:hypothetical protein
MSICMHGIITNINHRKGMVAVLTANEDYSIFETTNSEDYEIQDRVSWEDEHPLGDCKLMNLTKNEKESVYFQNHCVSNSNSVRQLLMH